MKAILADSNLSTAPVEAEWYQICGRTNVTDKIANLILNDDVSKAETLLRQKPQGFEWISSLLREVQDRHPPLQKLRARAPGFIKVATSYTCRLKCEMCGSGFQDRPSLFEQRACLTPVEFNQLLPWMKTSKNVIFSGMGETLDSPHIIDFLKKTDKKVTTVITSGTSLNTRKIKKLIHANLNFLHLSFDGKTSLGHGAGKDAYIRNFWRTVQKIQRIKKELKSELPLLGIQITVNRENIENLNEIFCKAHAHKVNTIFIIPMTLANRSLFEKSIFSNYTEAKKRINRVLSQWNKRGMDIRIMGQYKIMKDAMNLCYFVDNWLAFPPDIDLPSICCGGITMPVRIMKDAILKYWNSFPFRYFRFLHFCSEGARLPFACQTCWVTNLEGYSKIHARMTLRGRGQDAYSLYQRASLLKRRGFLDDAERQFTRLLNIEPKSRLTGKAYFHLGEMKIMKKEYDMALPLMERAVQYCFDHKKAFVYLYILWIRSGERKNFKRKKKAHYKFCDRALTLDA